MITKRNTGKRYEGKGLIPKGLNDLLEAINSVRALEVLRPAAQWEPSELSRWLKHHQRLRSYLHKQAKAYAKAHPEARAALTQRPVEVTEFIHYQLFCDDVAVILDLADSAGHAGHVGRYPTSYCKDEEGLLVLQVEGVCRLLLNTEVDRLRDCAACGNIFWASRLDQVACQKSCAAVLRVRRSRELHKENAALYAKAKAKTKKKGTTK